MMYQSFFSISIIISRNYQHILGSCCPVSFGSIRCPPMDVLSRTSPGISCVTVPITAASFPSGSAFIAASMSLDLSVSHIISIRPSHAQYNASSPSISHAASTAGSTGIWFCKSSMEKGFHSVNSFRGSGYSASCRIAQHAYCAGCSVEDSS